MPNLNDATPTELARGELADRHGLALIIVVMAVAAVLVLTLT